MKFCLRKMKDLFYFIFAKQKFHAKGISLLAFAKNFIKNFKPHSRFFKKKGNKKGATFVAPSFTVIDLRYCLRKRCSLRLVKWYNS